MQLSFAIPEIYAQAAAIVNVFARGREDYEALTVTPDNYPLFDEFLDSAVTEVRKALAVSYPNTHSIQNDTLIITLDDNSGLHDDNTVSLLTSQVLLAVVYMLASVWITPHDKEEGEMYANSADSYLHDAAVLFAKRNHLDPHYAVARDDDKKISDSGQLLEYDKRRKGDHAITPSGPATDYTQRSTADKPIAHTGSLAETEEAVRDNIIEKPWAVRDCIRDKDGKLIIIK